MPLHTDTQYEEELTSLKSYIQKMGTHAQAMIDLAMRSLVERKSDLAQQVIDKEEPAANQLELDIDDHCMTMLALRQPAASDLRFIAVSLKLSTDLERIGDLAVNIAQRAITLNCEEPIKSYVDIPKMAEAVQRMVAKALDAFVTRNASEAERVCAMDNEVDDLNKKVFADVIAIMEREPKTAARGIALTSVARHLERVADHATTIAEAVVFMVKGKDIRHSSDVP